MTSPLPLNVVTKPGQSVTADIRVKNNGTQRETLKVELLKFGASGDTGRPQLQEREATDVYFDWVKFSETTFVAEPNVWKTIKMTINAPKEAAFGYYFAVLFSRSNPDRPTAGASGVEGGVASLVLLNVEAPGARREAKVAEIVATQKVYEFLPAKFKVKLRNAGNVHVAPAGTMFIKQGSKEVGMINFNVERGNILPNTNRVFELSWSDGFPVYKEEQEGSKTTQELKWDFGNVQKLRFGKYTAHLVAVYDDGQRDVAVEATVSFWVIPWRILGVGLLIILFVVFGTWAFLRFVWRNIKKQAVAVSAKVGQSEEPDESSLAAALSKKKKQHRHAKENDPPMETQSRNDSKKQKQSREAIESQEVATRMAPGTNERPRSERNKNKNHKSTQNHGKNDHREEAHKPHRGKSKKHNRKHKKGKKHNG
jgi:hypothetical protein